MFNDALVADSRRGLPKVLRRAFDSLFFLVGWFLWKERNARTFGETPRSPALLLQAILDEADFWIAAGFRRLSALVCRRSRLPLLLALFLSAM